MSSYCLNIIFLLPTEFTCVCSN